MSWHYSQALVEEYSEANSLDGELFAPLRSSDMPVTYLWLDKTKESLTLFQFGMMSDPSTENHGEVLLTWYQGVFRAKISHVREKERGLKGPAAACGESLPESLGKYDRGTCSWRTVPSSGEEGLIVSPETWPAWGMMRNGELYPLQMSGPPILGRECGSYPTPTANMGERGGRGDLIGLLRGYQYSKPRYKMLALKYPTPQKADCKTKAQLPRKKQDRQTRSETPGSYRADLADHVVYGGIPTPQIYPTPTRSAANQGQNQPDGRRGQTLVGASRGQMWSTPTTSTGGPEPEGKTGRKLVTQVQGQLNPSWVEWLMGWPIEWTDSKPLGMDKFRQWQLLHGGS